jgi:hypothetical protein
MSVLTPWDHVWTSYYGLAEADAGPQFAFIRDTIGAENFRALDLSVVLDFACGRGVSERYEFAASGSRNWARTASHVSAITF